MEKLSDKPTLTIPEWLAILATLGIILMLTVISVFNKYSPRTLETGTPHFISDQEIEIAVQGAVEHPGRIRVKKGSTIKEVLDQAKLLPDADVRRIHFDAKVRRNQLIKIPKQAFITITVEGAVANIGPITMPKGSRFEDLLSKIIFADNAAKDKLTKLTRRLKDGEIITIPAKTNF